MLKMVKHTICDGTGVYHKKYSNLVQMMLDCTKIMDIVISIRMRSGIFFLFQTWFQCYLQLRCNSGATFCTRQLIPKHKSGCSGQSADCGHVLKKEERECRVCRLHPTCLTFQLCLSILCTVLYLDA